MDWACRYWFRLVVSESPRGPIIDYCSQHKGYWFCESGVRPRICISDRFPDSADTTLKIHTLRTRTLINVSIVVQSISLVQLFMTLWTVAHQVPLSMEFPRQEYWSELPFPSPGDLPNPGIEPRSSEFQADSLLCEPSGKPKNTGVGSLSLLQGIFLPRDQTEVFSIAGGFFTSWATREALWKAMTAINSEFYGGLGKSPLETFWKGLFILGVIQHIYDSWEEIKYQY